MMLPIYLLQFEDRYTMTATFMRFEEYYESPKFSGKMFSHEEFMDWYAKEHGTFTYFDDWGGFNVPSIALKPFYEGKFDPLTKKEIKFLDLFKDVKGEFYIIGVCRKETGTIRHEFVHALYWLNPEYQTQVKRIIRKFDIKKIRKRLLKLGYGRRLLIDEINTYVLTGISGLATIKKSDIRSLKRDLKRIFENNFGYSIKKVSKEFLLRQMHNLNIS